MGRGYAWLNTGPQVALPHASNFVRTLTERQGRQVVSPDVGAYQMAWINRDRFIEHSKLFEKDDYGQQLTKAYEA